MWRIKGKLWWEKISSNLIAHRFWLQSIYIFHLAQGKFNLENARLKPVYLTDFMIEDTEHARHRMQMMVMKKGQTEAENIFRACFNIEFDLVFWCCIWCLSEMLSTRKRNYRLILFHVAYYGLWLRSDEVRPSSVSLFFLFLLVCLYVTALSRERLARFFSSGTRMEGILSVLPIGKMILTA